ncbi:MAG: DEAD/DEAH box helicase [Pseudomonadota bacterium]
MKFIDLDLDPKVLAAVAEAGYQSPTPIQAQAIPEALKGRDVIGIAQTGTGKTASFTLPMITLLAKGRARARMPRSLILCPTRELAAQVAENFEIYGKKTKLSMALLIGGVNFANQDKLIDRGVDVLIATPGRLLDHFERGKLMLTGIEIMVVDEADRMLDMGFIPDIERIFNLTNALKRQTLFFSATMAPEIVRITDTFLHNPLKVEVARQATTGETITQGLCKFSPTRRDRTDAEKRAVLRALLDGEGEKFRNAIIFCNRKRDIGTLFKSLQKHGYNAGALHGDLDQSVRMATLDGFRNGEIKVLVASDVAARGLDIPNVSHVVNYDVPTHPEDYVHRIGRTGRAGREGTAFTIAVPADDKYLDRIHELTKAQIPTIDVPETARPSMPAAEDKTEAEAKAKPRRSRSRRGSTDDALAVAGEEKTAEPIEVAEEAPKREVERERDHHRDRGDRGRERDRGKRGGRGRNGGGSDRPVIGLGDHVPAFLLRPVPAHMISKGSSNAGAPATDETPEGADIVATSENEAA